MAAACAGASGPLAGGALPALLAVAAAGVRGEGPVAAAVVTQTCPREENSQLGLEGL